MDYQPQLRDKIIAILRQDMLKVLWREDRADDIIELFKSEGWKSPEEVEVLVQTVTESVVRRYFK